MTNENIFRKDIAQRLRSMIYATRNDLHLYIAVKIASVNLQGFAENMLILPEI